MYLLEAIQLIFISGAEAVNSDYFSTSINDGTTLSLNFTCGGHESSLLDCPFSLQSNCTANNSLPVGVVCRVPCENGDLRVIGGSSLYEGRLEICQDQAWGTICHELWGSYDAAVACRQLGFSAFG